jgi:hypothetical protein
MPVERAAGGTSLVDVLDRVLDKGIVIDAWVRVSLVGIDLITVEARVQVATVSRPAIESTTQDLAAENVALRAELAERDRVAARKRRRTEGAESPPW